MKTAELLSIQNDDLHLKILPSLGASTKFLAAKIRGEWVEIMRHSADPIKSSSDCANFIMAPYPNRIRDGKFSFESTAYQLRFAEKHAIHGDVRNRPWNIKSHDDSSVSLTFNSNDFSDLNFPFPFSALLKYELKGNSLRTSLKIKNEGQKNMPAGAGFHPYYPRTLFGNDEVVQIKFHATSEYPFVGELPLPTGPEIELKKEHDFSTLRPLDLSLDHCFGGWQGPATIFWPESRVTLNMQASENTSHLVVYSPPGKDFFAFEPQTQMIDGFNFQDRSAQNGVLILEPKAELGMWYSIKVD